MPSPSHKPPIGQLPLRLLHVPKDRPVEQVKRSRSPENEEGWRGKVVSVGFGPVPPEDAGVEGEAELGADGSSEPRRSRHVSGSVFLTGGKE